MQRLTWNVIETYYMPIIEYTNRYACKGAPKLWWGKLRQRRELNDAIDALPDAPQRGRKGKANNGQ